MSEDYGNVVVFAGAGASKAVNQTSFPTTVEFFERLPPAIQNDTIFGFIIDYLQSVEKPQQIDIEHVLWNAQLLIDFFRSTRTPKDVVGYAVANNFIGRVAPGQNSGNIPSHALSAITRLSSFIDQVDEIVFDLYNYEPTEEELAANWTLLLEILFREFRVVDLFTTNYDICIENALDIVVGQDKTRQYQGLTGNRRRVLNLDNWISAQEPKHGLLTKLHGSLDWKLQGEHIHVGDPVFTGDHAKQAIIYPGFKGGSTVPFYEPFHDYFRRSIVSADVLIFIGFAFRDPHINEVIANNLSPTAKVVVINPDRSVVFPYARARAKHIRKYFDAGGLKETFEWLRSKA